MDILLAAYREMPGSKPVRHQQGRRLQLTDQSLPLSGPIYCNVSIFNLGRRLFLQSPKSASRGIFSMLSWGVVAAQTEQFHGLIPIHPNARKHRYKECQSMHDFGARNKHTIPITDD